MPKKEKVLGPPVWVDGKQTNAKRGQCSECHRKGVWIVAVGPHGKWCEQCFAREAALWGLK